MYVNLDNLFSLEYVHHLTFLIIINQAAKKDVSQFLVRAGLTHEIMNDLEKRGYVKFIKGKKGQTQYEKIRLDTKGREYLESLRDVEVTEDDVKMFEYLCNEYLDHEDKERHIGNKKKTLLYCTEFRHIMELSLHQMYYLLWQFLQDFTHTKRLEYIFFNRKENMYKTFRNNIEDSKLYQYYDENREKIHTLWAETIKDEQ